MEPTRDNSSGEKPKRGRPKKDAKPKVGTQQNKKWRKRAKSSTSRSSSVSHPPSSNVASIPSQKENDSNKKQPSRPTMTQRKQTGLMFCSQAEIRTYIKVAFIYEFNEPAEEDWDHYVSQLKQRIGYKAESIRQIFKDIQRGVDPVPQKPGAGRPTKLGADNPGLVAAANAMNCGTPRSLALLICNETNQRLFPDDQNLQISLNTLISTIEKYTDCHMSKIGRRKTGKKDETSAWAIARVVFASQMKEQIAFGRQIEKGEITMTEAMESVRSGTKLYPLSLHGVIWLDEHHFKAVIGSSSHTGSFADLQYRIAVDEKTGALKKMKDGGKLPPQKHRLVAKFAKEARGLYGVVVAKDSQTGEVVGKFIATWDYTGKKLKSVKAKREDRKAELELRKNATKGHWKEYTGENPYTERYGTEELGEVELMKTLHKKSAYISEMVDHVIEEGNKMFKNTIWADTWTIYHDHLKIWWEKETQEHLKNMACPIEGWPERTWYDRQVRICGDANNAKVSSYYKNKLPGDSPELMPLDCHLFSDLNEACCRNVALTNHLQDDHELKYSLRTPDKVHGSLQRTIMSDCVDSERIIQDCSRVFEVTLDRIIDAEGCYIEDSSKKQIRSGERRKLQRTEKRIKQEKEEVKKLNMKVDPLVAAEQEKLRKQREAGAGVGYILETSLDNSLEGGWMEENVLETVPVVEQEKGQEEEEEEDMVLGEPI